MGRRHARSAALVRLGATAIHMMSSSRTAQQWRRSIEKLEKSGGCVSQTFQQRKEGRSNQERVPLDPRSHSLFVCGAPQAKLRCPFCWCWPYNLSVYENWPLSRLVEFSTGLHPQLHTIRVVVSAIFFLFLTGDAFKAVGGTTAACMYVKQRVA